MDSISRLGDMCHSFSRVTVRRGVTNGTKCYGELRPWEPTALQRSCVILMLKTINKVESNSNCKSKARDGIGSLFECSI